MTVSIVCLLLLPGLSAGCASRHQPTVVVYTSVDQQYSEPVLRLFAERTGIQALPVYDVEATKTTGLVNRLVAERAHPRADVFWNCEFAQTILLKEQGALAAYDSPSAEDIPQQVRDAEHYWAGTAGRARVIVVNTNLVKPEDYPASFRELLDERWPARSLAMALPLFGTSATHAAALYALWGPEVARRFYERLKRRGVQMVDGNSVVRDMVASGQARWGLTDTDDVAAGLRRGSPIAAVFPDQADGGEGTLVIPGTVALIADAPHPEEGRQLVDFLLSREVEGLLVQAGWCHVTLRKLDIAPAYFGDVQVKALRVSLDEAYQQLDRVKQELRDIFVR